ncbi:MAG TPA: AmmeMemoRadiSam system protein B [Gemmataceae bacterium]|nr:AmmeMemoRadiSam system protein B [Gemmataceae bacterium]
MSVAERPQLRPYLAASPEDPNRRRFIVHDLLRLNGAALRLTALELRWLPLFDGERTLRDIQAEAIRQVDGQIIPLEVFTRLASALDEALFLEGPRYRAAVDDPVRRPSCIGAYEADPDALRRQIEKLFTGPGGPGLPHESRPDDGLRALLAPHIDYARGGRTYAWGFKVLAERTPASLFVIVGTSHYCGHRRFQLTRKHFKTPLGIAHTDQDYIDRLVQHYGDGLFSDELMAHMPEHSIELEVVFLQYLFEGKRPIRIVPLVVGSFEDAVHSGSAPIEREEVRRMAEALRAVERETKEPICYIVSGDLAHIGPKFGDYIAVHDSQLAHSRQQDHAILRQAVAADPAGYFRVIAEEGDSRRICGLPPTYTVLEALRPSSGQLLHYDQYVHPRGDESVSFASVAFYR